MLKNIFLPILLSLIFTVMGFNPSKFSTIEDCDDCEERSKTCPSNPVERVTWDDTKIFIKKLNESLNLGGCEGKPSDPKGCYRLPTEAEWEYAARGMRPAEWEVIVEECTKEGTLRLGSCKTPIYFFGDDPDKLGDYAWYKNNSDNKVHPVGRMGGRIPNDFGLYDIHGNVQEWVEDRYDISLPGGSDPLRISSDWRLRTLRGGSWGSYAKFLRSASRQGLSPYMRRDNFVGFRLVRNL